MTIQAHPQIAAKGFVYASCHGRHEARRAVTALLRSQFPLQRIHVLVADPTGFSRVALKRRHRGPEGMALGVALGVVGALLWLLVDPLALGPLHRGPQAMVGLSTALLLGTAGYVLGKRQSQLCMKFQRRAGSKSEILVGLYADHRQAKATRAALKRAQAGRTYVARKPRNHRTATAAQRGPTAAEPEPAQALTTTALPQPSL